MIYLLEIIGALFTMAMGTLLHYTYEWSGRSICVALIAPTNQSIFEHLKLLLTPFLLWTLVEYVHYGQFMKNFIPAKAAGVLAGMIMMTIFYYICTALFGKSFLVTDIIGFFSAVAGSFALSHWLMTLPALGIFPVRLLSYGILLATVISFAACSIYPPEHPLFDVPHKSKRTYKQP